MSDIQYAVVVQEPSGFELKHICQYGSDAEKRAAAYKSISVEAETVLIKPPLKIGCAEERWGVLEAGRIVLRTFSNKQDAFEHFRLSRCQHYLPFRIRRLMPISYGVPQFTIPQKC